MSIMEKITNATRKIRDHKANNRAVVDTGEKNKVALSTSTINPAIQAYSPPILELWLHL